MNFLSLAPGNWSALIEAARSSPVVDAFGAHADDEQIQMLLQAPVTTAWWLAEFAPALLEQDELHILIVGLPGGPSSADGGRPYQLLPMLLDRPAMRVRVTIIIGARLAPTVAHANPKLSLREHLGVESTPAGLFDCAIHEWWSSHAGAAPDVCLVAHPRFDERPEFWTDLRELIDADLALGCLSRGMEEVDRDAWLLRAYGYDVHPHAKPNPWARRHSEALGQGAWGAVGWELRATPLPRYSGAMDRNLLARVHEAQKFLCYEYEVWNPLRFIGEPQQVEAREGAPADRLVGLPDHHLLSLDSGRVWVLEPDGLEPGDADVVLPKDVLASYPGEAAPAFERLLWAVETYRDQYRPREAAASQARHAQQLQDLRSELAKAMNGTASPGEIEAFTTYYLGGREPTAIPAEHVPLFDALRKGDWERAAELIIADAGLANAQDEDGRTSLFYAMQAKYYDLARRWLEAGCDPDHRDHEGFAVIHDMAKRDDPTPIELLQRYGADLDVGTGLGLTPAVLALRYGCWRVLGFLVAEGVDLRKSAIAGAAVADQYESVPELPRVLRAEIDKRLGKRRVIPIIAQAGVGVSSSS